jgi:hypothetical protein
MKKMSMNYLRKQSLAAALLTMCALIASHAYSAPRDARDSKDSESNAPTRDISGVKFEESAVVNGKTLMLNGGGPFLLNRNKIFVTGLYTPRPITSTQELFASPGPLQIRMVMTKTMESELMSRQFMSSLRGAATREERQQFVVQLSQMGEGFAAVGSEWKSGSVLTISWQAGKGTVIKMNDKQVVETLSNDLTMQAMFKMWVGDNSDPKLKRLMLGAKE